MLLKGHPSLYVPLAPASLVEGKLPSPESHEKRWKFIQNLVAQFWKRWVKEYLHTLQPRGKWRKEVPNLQVGDIVLVSDDNLPPLQWPLGKILKIFTGNDDMCRAVRAKTAKGEYVRPVVKIRVLPVKSDF